MNIRSIVTPAFIKDLIGISIGCLIAAFGYSVFLIPFKAAPGGVSALAQILFYFFNIPLGTGMLLFNVPLFFIGVLTLGRLFGFKTLFAILSVGMYSDFLSPNHLSRFHSLQPFLYRLNEQASSFTSEPILGVLAGSLFLGVGLGIVFKFNGSCGSTDIPALLLRKYLGVTVGTGYLLVDSFIILGTGIVFQNANLILWSLFALFITSKVTDHILHAFPMARGVFIITEKSAQIRQVILHDISRGCTVFAGEGGFTGEKRDIIYTVTNVHELARLKESIKQVDKKAFVIVMPVQEVLGEGFQLLA